MVSRRAIVVAGLSTIAMAASGCSGGSDAERPPATTTEQVATQPPGRPTVNIAKFRAAIEESFDSTGYETSWYRHVTGMKMAHGRLKIATDIDPESDVGAGSGPQGTISGTVCLAAINFAINSPAGDGIETATVFGSDGEPLASCA